MRAELLSQLDRYLLGKCSLRDLETWLLASLQGILDCGDEVAIRTADQVDADIVEFGERLFNEATLRERWGILIRFGEAGPRAHPDLNRTNKVSS